MGLGFLGRDAVLAQSFIKRARSFEEKRAIVPRVAAKDPIARRAFLRTENAFRAAYRIALEQWRKGCRHICFPAGTWWMRVHHGVRVDINPVPT
jgi:hypothetical protein